ncbi:MAG: futalosine hydrolase [Myxococcota bacterium]
MTLFVYAAPKEGEPFASDPRFSELGVGKVAATVALTRLMLERSPQQVVLFGVAGAHPGGPEVGQACLVESDWLADEGVATPGGFLSLEDLGLGRRGPFTTSLTLGAWIRAQVGGELPSVIGATVSTCSGSDARAASARSACPEALVETMEGAAVGAVCEAFGVPWAQLRVISNRTGDREAAGWDLPGALTVLHDAVGRLLET